MPWPWQVTAVGSVAACGVVALGVVAIQAQNLDGAVLFDRECRPCHTGSGASRARASRCSGGARRKASSTSRAKHWVAMSPALARLAARRRRR